MDFKGQMLLKGAHDNVIIYLVATTIETYSQQSSVFNENSFEKSTNAIQLQDSIGLDIETKANNNPNQVKSVSSTSAKNAVDIVNKVKGDPCAGNRHIFESLMKEESTDASSKDNDTSAEAKYTTVYPLSELKSPAPYPPGVDVNSREQYLSPTEFFDLFKMNLNVFKALPKWKQDNMKKKCDLF